MSETLTPAALEQRADDVIQQCTCERFPHFQCECRETAACLRYGAASLRRWEALKAEAKEFSDQQQTNQHRQGAAMMAATFYRTMQRMEREPEQADSGPDCTCHSASNSSCAAHRKTYSNAADPPPARREGSE